MYNSEELRIAVQRETFERNLLRRYALVARGQQVAASFLAGSNSKTKKTKKKEKERDQEINQVSMDVFSCSFKDKNEDNGIVGGVSLKIFFMDGSSIDSSAMAGQTQAKHLLIHVKNESGLQCDGNFGIAEFCEGMPVRFLEDDEYIGIAGTHLSLSLISLSLDSSSLISYLSSADCQAMECLG